MGLPTAGGVAPLMATSSTTTVGVLAAVGALLAIGVTAAAVRGGRRMNGFVYATTGLVALVPLACGLLALAGVSGGRVVLPIGLPWTGMPFALDVLSAFFLVIVDLGVAVVSLAALGYGRHEPEPGRVLPFFPLFAAGMNLVVIAADAFGFLLAWEFMSLASWALVSAHHHEADNRAAGRLYLIMASFGTLALVLAFGLLSGGQGDFGFAALKNGAHAAWVPGVVLGLALLGAGSKAGLVPLHAWLPLAHPAAPSHVSALMSGVMTKVAIYGFVRLVFDLAGPPTWWWGVIVMAIGAATAVIGVLHATIQRDLKRMLAFSTVENIGIVFIALGLALAFAANGFSAAAALAATAALFHALNHSLFKSLLFLGAGAVVTATGTRDVEALGGLIKRMPTTAVVMLGGAFAASALPPLNGFVSEWMIFQAVLLSPDLPQWGLKILVPAVGAMLAFAAALAAAAFVRAYGIAFLGRARSRAAAEAVEVDGFMRAAMVILFGLSLLAGTLPGLVIDAAGPVATAMVGHAMPDQRLWPELSIVPVSESRSSYSGLLVILFIVFSTTTARFVIHRFASRAIRRAPAWDCGFPEASPATQYTAESFAEPIRRVFGAHAFAATSRVSLPPPGDGAPARLETTTHDLAWEGLYQPIGRLIDHASARIDMLQFLSIRAYLGLVFAALVGLLMVVAIWG